MNSLLKELTKENGYLIYPQSKAEAAGASFVMVKDEQQEYLLVSGAEDVKSAFQGTETPEGKKCELTHHNRLALNTYLEYTKPKAAGKNGMSMGLGDRLGLASYAHLGSVWGQDVFPVIAQQSKRELNLTGRTYEDVLDDAVWAAFKAGWKSGFGADGDHLKNKEEIAYALQCGYSMITLDCSEVLQKTPDDPQVLLESYMNVPAALRQRLEQEYLQQAAPEELDISYTPLTLQQIVVCYWPAVELGTQVYHELLKPLDREVDLELSLDETSFATAPAAHYFVAKELEKAGVVINSMAPRFVGEFQKAVDYIGDVEEFRKDFACHCAIADHFGYKISVHSGSDKFSVFPIVGELTKGRYHLKTAGTSWLEALRVIAKEEPELFRRMYKNAVANFENAKAYYVVHAKLENIRPLEQMADSALPEYLDENDARQLLHITYGYQLTDPVIGPQFFAAMKKHEWSYFDTVGGHIARHVALLKNNL